MQVLVYNKQLSKVLEKMCVCVCVRVCMYVGMAAIILKLGSSLRWVVIFTLRPLYHREVGSDKHRVGGRGGSDPLEKTTVVRLLSYPCLLSVCQSAFVLCLFYIVFHISFPPLFPVFLLFASFFHSSFSVTFSFSHFLPKFISTAFLSFHDNQGCLFYISWHELFGKTQPLPWVLEDLSYLKHIRRPYPNVIGIVTWDPHCKAPGAYGLGWRGEIRDRGSLSENTFTVT